MTVTESKDAQIDENTAPEPNWRIDLTGARMFRRTNRSGYEDEHDLRVEVPTELVAEYLTTGYAGYTYLYSMSGSYYTSNNSHLHPHPMSAWEGRVLEEFTRPAADANLSVDHLREVAGLAAYENMWEVGHQHQVVNAIMRHYITPLQKGEDPVTFREAARRGWNGFAYGVSRARWQALEDKIRANIGAGQRIDTYTHDLNIAVGNINLRTHARANLIRAFNEVRETPQLNTMRAAMAISARCAELGSGVNVAQYATLRELIRTHFTLGVATVPEDIAAITDVEQLQKLLATEREQTQFGLDVLYKHADDRGWCGEYDEIMRRAGWPGRPRNWSVMWRITGHEPLTEDWLRRNVSGTCKLEGTLTRTWENTMAVPLRSQEEPSREECLATEDAMREWMRSNYPTIVIDSMEYSSVS